MESSKETLFVTATQLYKETGIQYKQLLKDIHNKVLPAVKIGNSYYVYTSDASKYIYNLVCKARGVDPNEYECLLGLDQTIFLDMIKKGMTTDDKPKN